MDGMNSDEPSGKPLPPQFEVLELYLEDIGEISEWRWLAGASHLEVVTHTSNKDSTYRLIDATLPEAWEIKYVAMQSCEGSDPHTIHMIIVVYSTAYTPSGINQDWIHRVKFDHEANHNLSKEAKKEFI